MSIPPALLDPHVRLTNIANPMNVVALRVGYVSHKPFVWPNLTRTLADTFEPKQPTPLQAKVLRMRDEGCSVGEIAIETGYSHTRIRAILKEHGRT